MLAIKLKSFIHLDSRKLTKDVCCGFFKSNLLENSRRKTLSYRWFTSVRNSNHNPLILMNNAKIYCTTPKKQTKSIKISKSPITWKNLFISLAIGSVFVGRAPCYMYLNAGPDLRRFMMRTELVKPFAIPLSKKVNLQGYLLYLKNKKLMLKEKERQRALGKAKIGGRFDLIDQDNQPVKSEDLLGQWLLIYFGFTHCPDICPDEIEKMVEVVNIIEQRSDMHNVKPVFITVDPERDSPSVVKKYVNEFSDKILGLTGTVEQIGKVCKNFRVYFSPGPKDSDSDYIVDHSIIMYLIDPEGNFIDYYGQNKNSSQIVYSIEFNQSKYDLVRSKSLTQKIQDFVFGSDSEIVSVK